MALPIGATPVLKGKEADAFLEKIHKDQNKPVNLTPTPRLVEACELIKEHAKRNKKSIY